MVIYLWKRNKMSYQDIITKLQKIIDKTGTDLQALDSQAVVTGDMQIGHINCHR